MRRRNIMFILLLGSLCLILKYFVEISCNESYQKNIFFKMKQEINLIEIGVLTGIEIDSMMNKMSS